MRFLVLLALGLFVAFVVAPLLGTWTFTALGSLWAVGFVLVRRKSSERLALAQSAAAGSVRDLGGRGGF